MKFFNKKTIFFTAASVVLSMVSSCDRDYLETSPTDAVSQEGATQSVANLKTIINGMHRNMYYRQNSSQGQNGATGIMMYMEVMGEDLIFPATGPNWYISTLRWQDNANANSGNLFYPYDFYYGQIRTANIVLKATPVVVGDQADKDKLMGEAYAFRAMSYYMLTQIYGKRYVPGGANTQLGVPLRLDDGYDPIPRSTVEENYTSINNDLIKAFTLLNGKSRSDKSHFNANVVKGLMARVALTQGKYAEAATYAKDARAGFALMDNATYKSGFNNYNVSEWIWGYKPLDSTSDYFGNFMGYMSRNYNSSQIRQAPKVVNNLLFNKFAATDVRTQVIDPTGKHLSLFWEEKNGVQVIKDAFKAYTLVPYTSQKFLSVNASGSVDYSVSLGDIPFMRAAEMYLIEAEALARDNKEAQSKIVFNEFEKNRNPSYVGATTTGQAYIDEILNSRRLELWGEGFRFLDLKRLNLPLDRTGTNQVSVVTNNLLTVPAGDKRWTWLIPQGEIDASKGLVKQNDL
ncbi:RagB/SusD family nutrient uptake outer membrane protein [Chryseobacterium gotjawalense]|uniref:RagB/SusD family nutrient uptake outer membrane protein n=1 Tax=Chryseobacterium gotjawalense TaxID=3042315 RepID=A0ABY8R966_9FLAO|nr:RagB/SusD family nutrient uptake outer membrane protein [Chryseobacterium sp. wdc7]WHF50495.1 RagB/SusD family nutrient uptake outer membrane protein [Chryseobacterium sp. wdc7]